jgi:hypothetical protein
MLRIGPLAAHGIEGFVEVSAIGVDHAAEPRPR